MTVSQSAVDVRRWLGSDAGDLPVLPLVAAELSALFDDSGVSREQMVEIVVRGPVMAARMLKLVNSAYFGLAEKVINIRHAVFLLGLRTVRMVALAAAIFSAFQDLEGGIFDLRRFWRHSTCAAAICSALAKRCGTFDSDAAFTVGLLHDIGKLVLVRYRPSDAASVVQYADRNVTTFVEAERHLLPLTHADLGAWLTDCWGLSPVLTNSLAGHHDAPVAALPPLDAALRFADYFCAIKGIMTSGCRAGPQLTPEVWRALGVESADLPRLIDLINTEIQAAEGLLVDP